jgi:SAM-dependent methyltransferase
MRAAIHLFEQRVRPGPDDEIYITEQTTPLYQEFLRRHPRLVGSEYIAATTPRGETSAAGIRCEDLTSLTFPPARFDHLLCFEVLEHIPDYQVALRECARVLKPGGRLFCSVPFHGDERHTVRARVTEDGSIEHLLPPEYHGDPVNPAGVLCYRYFGLELIDDLREAGFSDASAWLYWSADLGYLGEDRVVFVAVR